MLYMNVFIVDISSTHSFIHSDSVGSGGGSILAVAAGAIASALLSLSLVVTDVVRFDMVC